MINNKERINIYIPKDFKIEIEEINKVLRKTQKQYKRLFFNTIPHPYSAGNEISSRYFAFQEMSDLLKNIILEYIPEELTEYYLNKIPKTPLEKLLKSIANDSNNKIKPVDKTASSKMSDTLNI